MSANANNCEDCAGNLQCNRAGCRAATHCHCVRDANEEVPQAPGARGGRGTREARGAGEAQRASLSERFGNISVSNNNRGVPNVYNRHAGPVIAQDEQEQQPARVVRAVPNRVPRRGAEYQDAPPPMPRNARGNRFVPQGNRTIDPAQSRALINRNQAPTCYEAMPMHRGIRKGRTDEAEASQKRFLSTILDLTGAPTDQEFSDFKNSGFMVILTTFLLVRPGFKWLQKRCVDAMQGLCYCEDDLDPNAEAFATFTNQTIEKYWNLCFSMVFHVQAEKFIRVGTMHDETTQVPTSLSNFIRDELKDLSPGEAVIVFSTMEDGIATRFSSVSSRHYLDIIMKDQNGRELDPITFDMSRMEVLIVSCHRFLKSSSKHLLTQVDHEQNYAKRLMRSFVGNKSLGEITDTAMCKGFANFLQFNHGRKLEGLTQYLFETAVTGFVLYHPQFFATGFPDTIWRGMPTGLKVMFSAFSEDFKNFGREITPLIGAPFQTRQNPNKTAICPSNNNIETFIEVRAQQKKINTDFLLLIKERTE